MNLKNITLRFFTFLALLSIFAPMISFAAAVEYPPDPGTPPNLVYNGSFSQMNKYKLPTGWSKGGYGNNQAVYIYPVFGHTGSNDNTSDKNAVQVQITSYTNGDAKWYFKPVSIVPGKTYLYTDFYKSSVPNTVTVQYLMSDGSFKYQDIGQLNQTEPSFFWSKSELFFTVPANVKSATVFHLIQNVGYLTIDDVTLRQLAANPFSFQEGMVSLNFDDGWQSAYDSAAPILKNAGMHGTFYIVTNSIGDKNFMTPQELVSLNKDGNEIGDHTKDHLHLPQLSSDQIFDQIKGAKDALQSWGLNPTTFAYPYGEYNNTVINAVKQIGFNGARSVNGNFALTNTDKYLLPRKPVDIVDSPAEVQSWIDQSIKDKSWLILVFHQIDSSGQYYSTTPDVLQQIVGYLKSKNVKVVTNAEGLALMK